MNKITIKTNNIKQEATTLQDKQNKINNSFKKVVPMFVKTLASYELFKFLSKHLFKHKNKKEEKTNILIDTKDTIQTIYRQRNVIKSVVGIVENIKETIKKYNSKR